MPTLWKAIMRSYLFLTWLPHVTSVLMLSWGPELTVKSMAEQACRRPADECTGLLALVLGPQALIFSKARKGQKER